MTFPIIEEMQNANISLEIGLILAKYVGNGLFHSGLYLDSKKSFSVHSIITPKMNYSFKSTSIFEGKLNREDTSNTCALQRQV